VSGKLCLSPEARKDLEEIKAYITEALENPTAAVNVVSRKEELTSFFEGCSTRK